MAFVDLRPILLNGETDVATITRECSADDAVTIPPLVAHGFLAIEPTELLYLVTGEYDGTDEFGFRWDDPAAGIDWPRTTIGEHGPLLSERDRSSSTLGTLIAQLREQLRAT